MCALAIRAQLRFRKRAVHMANDGDAFGIEEVFEGARHQKGRVTAWVGPKL